MELKEFLKSKLGFVIILVIIFALIKWAAANLFGIYNIHLNLSVALSLIFIGFLFFIFSGFKEKWADWKKGGLIGGAVALLFTLIFFVQAALSCRHEGCIGLAFILLYGLIGTLIFILAGALAGLMAGKISSKK